MACRINCSQDFEHVVLDYALFKARGEGRRNMFLENIEEKYKIRQLLEDYPCDKDNIIQVCKEVIKDGLNMGKIWAMVVLAGAICQRDGSMYAAYELLNWLSCSCLIPVLFSVHV